MDWHPIQGGVAILLVASCYRNRDKVRHDDWLISRLCRKLWNCVQPVKEIKEVWNSWMNISDGGYEKKDFADKHGSYSQGCLFRNRQYSCDDLLDVNSIHLNGLTGRSPANWNRVIQYNRKNRDTSLLYSNWHSYISHSRLFGQIDGEKNWKQEVTAIGKIQLVVYYQCCVLIGWATSRLFVIAH